MRLIRLIKKYWYVSIGFILLIIVFIMPKNIVKDNSVINNVNHNYSETISVYVDGEVVNCGKMYFYKNSTIKDLLNASKVTDYANITGLKLTDILVDGQTYTINIDLNNEKTVCVLNKTTKLNPISNVDTKIENNIGDMININTATSKDLETLPSIGETRANSIILYRKKNGNFENIEDLKKVDGISDAIYNQVKDYITC